MKKEITIKNGSMFYNNVDLTKLALEFGTPLKITFLDVIKNRICELKACFDEEIKNNNYSKDFIYLNANKANYGALEIEEAFLNADGLETSSYHDLLLTKEIFEKYHEKNKLIVCNGIKPKTYLDEIIYLCVNGYNIINIIDNVEEYEYLKSHNVNLKVGLRIHLASLYKEDDEVVENDRFGLNKDEFDYIIDDLCTSSLVLTTIHFHQRGFDYEEEKFLQNIHNVFDTYYVKAKDKYDTLDYLDIGGGTPLPVNSDFDYHKWASLLLKTLKLTAKEFNIEEPAIISENGKYSQKDSTVNIYEVIKVKHTDKIPWYVLDGSLLIALPEYYALKEEILVTPINNLDKELVKGRLTSITCDCDDIYLGPNKNYMLLPKFDKDRQFIGLLGTGSYQNSMNGKGGVHHCLLPEEKDIIVFTKNNKIHYEVRNELQTFDDMKKIIRFNKNLK